MQRWIDRAVIGLNLCPFAKAVVVKGQLRLCIERSAEEADMIDALERELCALRDADPAVLDTSLLVLPHAPAEFLLFQDLLRRCNRRLRKLRLEGVIQIAAFHPAWQFADLEAADIANHTNRSPYPALHLLREASIARALAGGATADTIVQHNIQTLRRLGPQGWAALGVGAVDGC